MAQNAKVPKGKGHASGSSVKVTNLLNQKCFIGSAIAEREEHDDAIAAVASANRRGGPPIN